MNHHAWILEQGQHAHSLGWPERHGLERIAYEDQDQGEESLIRSELPPLVTVSHSYHRQDGEEPEPKQPGACLSRPECGDSVDEWKVRACVAVDVGYLEIVSQQQIEEHCYRKGDQNHRHQERILRALQPLTGGATRADEGSYGSIQRDYKTEDNDPMPYIRHCCFLAEERYEWAILRRTWRDT
jgi:hypothetical protein